MKCRQSVSLIAIAAFTLWLTACGGSGSSPTPPPVVISVAFSAQPPSSLVTSMTTSITAVVTNDSKNAGVTWTVTCSSAACGSFNPASTASGSATTYTAPTAIPTSGTVMVTATSVTDTTKSMSATITITAPAAVISVALNPTPPTSLVTGTTASLTAVVSNDSKNAGVNWSVTCGSSGACGSFNPTGTASGSATVYTAPAAVPTGNTVMVTATSVTDPTKFASATITITAPLLANGTYVYHFSGWDANGPVFFAGAFTVSGGAITGGEQDFSDPKAGYGNALVASSSSLTAAGGNIQIVLATTNTAIGVSGVVTLRGTVVSSTRVLISEFDTFASATGSIDLQTSTAAPAGGYAFVVSGWYLSSTPSPLAVGGVLNVSGGSLVAADSVFDYNNGGNVGQAQLFSSGTISAPDSFGRVTFDVTPSSATGVPEFILTGYIVGTNQIQLVESQTDPLSADLGGMALGQGTNTYQFTQASLANTTYAYSASGEDIHGLTSLAGNFVFGPSGSISGALALNDLSFFVQDTITGGSFVVDQTGRVTMNGVQAQVLGTSFTFQLYLDGNGNALELGADSLQATAGVAYLKTATSADFEGNYALGGQGYLNATGEPGWGAAGPVTISSDALKGFTDYTPQGGPVTSNQALTGTENSSAGTLSITGLDATSFTTARGYAYYPIDSTRVLAIEVDGAQIGLLRLEQVH